MDGKRAQRKSEPGVSSKMPDDFRESGQLGRLQFEAASGAFCKCGPFWEASQAQRFPAERPEVRVTSWRE